MSTGQPKGFAASWDEKRRYTLKIKKADLEPTSGALCAACH